MIYPVFEENFLLQKTKIRSNEYNIVNILNHIMNTIKQ